MPVNQLQPLFSYAGKIHAFRLVRKAGAVHKTFYCVSCSVKQTEEHLVTSNQPHILVCVTLVYSLKHIKKHLRLVHDMLMSCKMLFCVTNNRRMLYVEIQGIIIFPYGFSRRFSSLIDGVAAVVWMYGRCQA